MPTFRLATRDGLDPVETPYTPIQIRIGPRSVTLALHRDAARTWIISDPHSGKRITTVKRPSGTLNRALSPDNAKRYARLTALEFAQQIGFDRFLATLDQTSP